jgi:glycosyltransferase involved in cell wall biosynthesis
VVGPGDTRALEARAAELGLSGRVRFTGARRDVPALLAAIDFLVLPSRWEGMPYIALEAMASERLVVATPVDGARDLVRHGRTGLLAEAVNVDALRAVMRQALALSPAERGSLARAGRELVRAEFGLEGMVRGLVDVYAELVA